MARTLNILKRFSLADLGDGWTDCYVDYRPMTVGDVTKITQLKTDGMTNAQSATFALEHIKTHVVGGKVSALDDGKSVVVDLVAEDLDNLPITVIGDLFTEMSGGGLDPKGSQPVAAPSNEPTSEPKVTETSSSKA